MKKLLKTILVLVFIFIIFPKIGVYDYLFDRGNYKNIDENSTEIISDLDELSPKTRKIALKFLERCAEEGLNVKITETYRTQGRQNMLYEQGRSTPGIIVTWTKNSKHIERRAFDICKSNSTNPYGDEQFYRKCAEIGKEVGLTPGYYFTKYQDMPHFELNKWWMK